jgi:hypothetical protein
MPLEEGRQIELPEELNLEEATRLGILISKLPQPMPRYAIEHMLEGLSEEDAFNLALQAADAASSAASALAGTSGRCTSTTGHTGICSASFQLAMGDPGPCPGGHGLLIFSCFFFIFRAMHFFLKCGNSEMCRA